MRYQVIGGCIALTSWEPPDFLKVMLRRHVLQRVKGLALLSDPLSCEVNGLDVMRLRSMDLTFVDTSEKSKR